MNRHSSKEDIQMANRHMKRYSSSLIFRRIQTKTTMRNHLTPVRMANINISANNRCWRGWGERESFLHCWWECKVVQSLWNIVMEVPQKLKVDLPYDPAIALLGINPRDTGVLFWKDTCTPMFIAALPTIAKVWKEPQFPFMDAWIKKMWYTHTHTHTMEYYSAIQKNEILASATMWMEPESIVLSKLVSQRKANIIWLHSYENFKTQNRWTEGKGSKIIRKEGGGTKETLEYGEQREGYWRGCGRGLG